MASSDTRSARLEREMLDEAATRTRPHERRASIERLVEACNAICDQSGNALIAAHVSKPPPRHGYQVSPTTVDWYVRARGWPGPVRGTVQSDTLFKRYVDARESERPKPKGRQKTSNKSRDFDRILTGLPLLEDKMLVFEELDHGWRAARDLQILKQGLRGIVPIDIDELISGAPRSGTDIPISHLVDVDRKTLLELIKRITDPQKMRRMGLTVDGDRLRQTSGIEETLIKPQEMQLLRRLARLGDIDAEPIDLTP